MLAIFKVFVFFLRIKPLDFLASAISEIVKHGEKQETFTDVYWNMSFFIEQFQRSFGTKIPEHMVLMDSQP